MTLEFVSLSLSPASLPDAAEFIFGYLLPTHNASASIQQDNLGGDGGAGMIHHEKH